MAIVHKLHKENNPSISLCVSKHLYRHGPRRQMSFSRVIKPGIDSQPCLNTPTLITLTPISPSSEKPSSIPTPATKVSMNVPRPAVPGPTGGHHDTRTMSSLHICTAIHGSVQSAQTRLTRKRVTLSSMSRSSINQNPIHRNCNNSYVGSMTWVRTSHLQSSLRKNISLIFERRNMNRHRNMNRNSNNHNSFRHSTLLQQHLPQHQRRSLSVNYLFHPTSLSAP